MFSGTLIQLNRINENKLEFRIERIDLWSICPNSIKTFLYC